MTRKISHALTVLSYLLFVVGIVIFLILLQKQPAEVQPPQQVEQPQPTDERIAPAQPPSGTNQNKRKPRQAKSRRPKEKAQMYEADGNQGIN